MESPFRSEAAAFRFLLITIGAFALIVIMASISTVLGFLTFLALSAAAVAMYLRQRGPAPEREHVASLGGPDERRVLVVANETVRGEELLSTISTLALIERTQFLVVCPALNSRLKTFTSDEDPAREAAQARLDVTLARLASVGIEAQGEVGDGDPLVAVDDADANVRPERDRHLDTSAGEVELARARHRRVRPRALRRAGDARRRRPRDRRRASSAGELGPLLAGGAGDVVRDGLDLIRVERVLEGRHRSLAVRHAVDGELRRRHRLVEVRPDGSGRACVGERVARAAVGREDRLAVRRSLRRDARSGDGTDVGGDVRNRLVLIVDAERVALDVVATGQGP